MNLIRQFTRSRILLLALLCLSLSLSIKSVAQFQQVYLDPDPENRIINTSFYSATDGFVASENWIGFTSDGGRSFQQRTIGINIVDIGLQPVGFPWTTRGVKAFDRNNVLVYGEWSGVPSILSSADGGNTYRMVFYSRSGPLILNNGITDLVFPQNGNIGYAVDEDRVFKTVNKGQNWSLVYASVGSEFTSITAGADNNVYVYSETKMVSTSNGGLSWAQVPLPAGNIQAADFISPLKGWVNIYKDPQSDLYYTSDGGFTWVKKGLQHIPFNKIKFTDDKTGYGLIGLGVLKTTDSGRIWEVLPHQAPGLSRGGGFTTIGNFGQAQLWAGTSTGVFESSNNAGGTTVPAAVYVIDTAGVSVTNKINLVNYSKQGNQYKWFLNGQLISNNYNAQYSPTPLKYVDTIQLVVSNGIYSSDTATQLVTFSPVIIESFSPTTAAEGETVVIKGQKFWGLNYVMFGSTRATSVYYVSENEIHAVVGRGSSGAVYVNAHEGGAYKTGFVYNAPPRTDIAFTISDTILCKSESIQIRLQNTEAGVEYILIDGGHNIFGAVTGNGGEAIIRSLPISTTTVYSIWLQKAGIRKTLYLDQTASIRVEKTQSIMGADRVNIATGELINFTQQSKEAVTYNWTLHDGASIASFTGPVPTGVSYSTLGDKSVTLISISADGCRDTATLKATTVYDKSLLTDECFVQNVHDSDTYGQFYATTGLHKTQGTPDGGYILSGWGNTLVLPSRAGSTKPLRETDMAFIAKYSATGVLLWQCNQGRNGKINASAVDEAGNVYVIGSLKIHDYFYFNNGDSMRIGHDGEQLISFYERENAYILKMDPNGKYLWHTNLFNTLVEGHGYSVSDIHPTIITIQGNKLIVAGSYESNLNYSRNGSKQVLKSGWHDGAFRSFVLQLNTSGALGWGMYWDVPSGHSFSDIKLDQAGDILITGSYESDLILRDVGDNYTYTITRPGAYKRGTYLAKFSGAGKFLWKTVLTTLGSFATDVTIGSISLDANGNTYAIGGVPYHSDPKGFNITEEDASIRHVDPGTTFILKFDRDGHYLWGTGLQGNAFSHAGHAGFIKNNSIYFTFTAAQTNRRRVAYKLASTNGTSIVHSLHESEFAFAKYSLDGNLENIYSSGENVGGYLLPHGIYLDQRDNIIISGIIEPYNGATGSYNAFGKILNGNGLDGWMMKLKNDVCFTGTAPMAAAGPDKISCAKDDIVIGTNASADQYVWISSADGVAHFTAQPTINPTKPATYYLYATNNSGLVAVDSMQVQVNTIPVIETGKPVSVCANSPVTIGSTAIEGVNYSWESFPAGFNSQTASAVVQPSATTSYMLTATNQQGCTAKDTVKITVESFLPLSVTIRGPQSDCSGVENVYTAEAKNAGDSAVYHWTINGKEVGDKTAILKYSDFKVNDRLQVKVMPSLACASPQTGIIASRNIIVTEGRVPHAFILPMETNVCANQSVYFYCDEINNATGLSYDWRRNGAKVGRDTANFSINNPVDGDKIYVIVTASNGCGGRSVDTTPVVTLNVGSLKPAVTVAGNTMVIKGQSTNVLATVTGAGAAPSLRWEDSTSAHGWAVVPGTTAQAINYTPVATGDRLRAVVTVSDQCSGVVQKASTPITFVVNAITAINPDPVAVYGVSIFPNPASGVLYLRNLDLSDQWQSLSITGMDGRPAMLKKDIRGMTRLDLAVSTMPSGMYTLILTGKSGKQAFYKIILRR